MLKKIAYIVLTLLLLAPAKGSAQFFGNKGNGKKEPLISIQLDPRFPSDKDTLDLQYTSTTGITVDNIWSDYWLVTSYVPIFYLQDPFKNYSLDSDNPGKTKEPVKAPQHIVFSVTEFTKNTLKEIEDEKNALMNSQENTEDEGDENDEDAAATELPEEYDIWSNTTINPYNVKLADMKDTVRIDVSGFYPPADKYVTSEFGPRWGRIHAGIDLKVFKGDTIRAAFDGVVRIERYEGRGYGNFIVLRNDNGLETLYGHMSGFIAEEGQRVKAGDPIGLGGSTGHSTGYHLHFELRYLGNAINPRDAIDFDNPFSVKDNILVLTKDNFRYQRIHYSKSRRSRSHASRRGGTHVTIRKGDTLGEIARRNHTTVAKLKKLNGIKGNNIRSGKKLRVK